jgi:hypothetical protein
LVRASQVWAARAAGASAMQAARMADVFVVIDGWLLLNILPIADGGAGVHASMPHSMHKLWGGPAGPRPGPRGSPWTRSLLERSGNSALQRADEASAAVQGDRPTIYAGVRRWEKYAALGVHACSGSLDPRSEALFIVSASDNVDL